MPLGPMVGLHLAPRGAALSVEGCSLEMFAPFLNDPFSSEYISPDR